MITSLCFQALDSWLATNSSRYTILSRKNSNIFTSFTERKFNHQSANFGTKIQNTHIFEKKILEKFKHFYVIYRAKIQMPFSQFWHENSNFLDTVKWQLPYFTYEHKHDQFWRENSNFKALQNGRSFFEFSHITWRIFWPNSNLLCLLLKIFIPLFVLCTKSQFSTWISTKLDFRIEWIFWWIFGTKIQRSSQKSRLWKAKYREKIDFIHWWWWFFILTDCGKIQFHFFH